MGCSSGAKTKEEFLDTQISRNTPIQSNKQLNLVNIGTSNLIKYESDSVKNHYKVISKIGSGSFGKVYKVIHLASGQHRAMKMLKKDSVNYQDDDKQFLKEIEILSKIDHPNIIKIYEYFTNEMNYFIITELCEGGELIDQIYKVGKFSEYQAAKIMQQIFSSVFYIHSKNIVHRDLKPENILFESNQDDDIFIKLIDFGTCNYFDKKTKLTYKTGTPYYIAPEVLNKSYTNKCDIWSCGVIMYILLAGVPPFNGSDDQEIMENVKKGKFHLDTPEIGWISQEAKNLISQLLRYDPAKRITAEEAWIDPWIQNYSRKEKVAPNSYKIPVENIKNYMGRQKFQHATIAFLVHQASSTDMVKDLRKIFHEFDKNGDGQLSYDEVKEGFKRYFKNEDIADKEFDEIIKEMDLDNNKFIEYEEFLRVSLNMKNVMNEENLKIAFNSFDDNKDGKLSSEELKKILGDKI